jgi:GNAT superfamily N-acetyltransferase
MLSLIDRLSNPADAEFMNRTQMEQASGTRSVTELVSAGFTSEQASAGFTSEQASIGSADEQASIGFADEQASAGFTVRRAEAADFPALGDFFAGLSARTRYLRFFAPVTPNSDLLRLLCGEPGDVDAVVAVREGVIIGHAMAADAAPPPDPCGPETAHGCGATPAPDVGIVVADAWQGRRVGAALMRALITAVQGRGVTTLAMDVLAGNRKVLAMISAHWQVTPVGSSQDCITVHVRLPDVEQPRSAPADLLTWPFSRGTYRHDTRDSALAGPGPRVSLGRE